MRKNCLLFLGTALVILVVDQITKIMVVDQLHPHNVLPVIPGFFNLVLVKNRGMAFGIFNRSDSQLSFYFLVSATILAILLLLWFFLWPKGKKKGMSLALGLILGGAFGNLADRIRLGYVIDFLDFFIKNYHWPAFNAADSAVTVGTFLLLIKAIVMRENKKKAK